MRYLKNVLFALFVILTINPLPLVAGGWDLDTGPEIMTLHGKLVCVGCSLKKAAGSNSQCGIYTTHNIGLRLGDGSLWNFVNNETGHDIIFSHNLLEGKKAKITGFLYPTAHMIEILSIEVKGVTEKEIAQAALHEDKLIGKALLERKKGAPPVVIHYQEMERTEEAADSAQSMQPVHSH
jgi:hypothetical protein